MSYTDEQFIAKLREYLNLPVENVAPYVPVVRKVNLTIERDTTLRLFVYRNMPDGMRRELLESET